MLAGKRILLIIGGGIAAYKSLDLIRRYQDSGVTVTPVLTRAAEEFVTPLSVSALAGKKVYRDLFDLTDEAEMGLMNTMVTITHQPHTFKSDMLRRRPRTVWLVCGLSMPRKS